LPTLAAVLVLPEIRDDVIPVEVLVLGAIMLVIVTLIHGAGLDRIVALYQNLAETLRQKKRHPRMAMMIFSGAILLMLFLHLTEITIWGVVLHKIGLIPNSRDAIYFAANTYTTLGMGPMELPHSWRELSPMIAIAGLFTFAWTTSEMFNLVGFNRDLAVQLATARGKKPHGLRRHDVKAKAAQDSE
jgi:hypothetical protein